MKFDYVDFLVHILDVPYRWASQVVGETLGRVFGTVKDVHIDDTAMKSFIL